jgi:hypothetical protein
MSLNTFQGIEWLGSTTRVTVGQDTSERRFITAAGVYPAATADAYGVTQGFVANGSDADIVRKGIVPVVAGGTVTEGQQVEIVGATGQVQNKNAGVAVGRAFSSGANGDVVLIDIHG